MLEDLGTKEKLSTVLLEKVIRLSKCLSAGVEEQKIQPPQIK